MTQTHMTNSNINNLDTIVNDLQSKGKKVTIKVLKTRGPRKNELWTKSPAGMVQGRALGNVKSGDSTTKATTAGGGREQTMTPVCGIGKEMVQNLAKVQSNYAKQVRADRKAAAQERMQENLDTLLADIRG